MKELRGKVAVVTGAASGIGRGLAERFVSEGMKVVMADVEEKPLNEAADESSGGGADVLAVATDVSQRGDVDALADAAYDRFGAVHVLCNNAGVSGGGMTLWQTTENDWQWVVGVNLMGVVHGIQAFIPRMIEGGDDGHVVNTASILGLTSGAGSIYSVTKHGVTRLSEGLYHELKAAGSKIGVSVLCPGMIATRIISAERNRPDHLRNEDAVSDPQREQFREVVQARFLESGMPPAEVAAIVVDAIREGKLYVLTHPEMLSQVERRMKDILERRNPEPISNEGMLARLGALGAQGGGS